MKKSNSADEEISNDLFEKIQQVGEGTYGKVYKARNKANDQLVALKRIRLESEKEGFPITAMREIKLLQQLNHENILKLQEIISAQSGVYMVFEYMDFDLTGLLSCPTLQLEDAHIKCLLEQILKGLAYLHQQDILHRDIKGSNILLNKRGLVKLADFGLARIYSKTIQNLDFTNRVITIWYRPPELLLGATEYGPEVDIWGIGCLCIEMFKRRPIFQGVDEISQLEAIYKVMGTISLETWPEAVNLPWYYLIQPKSSKENQFKELFADLITPACLDLCEQMLEMNPERRISAKDALESDFFKREEPAPSSRESIPLPDGDWHEFEAKQRKKQKVKHSSK